MTETKENPVEDKKSWPVKAKVALMNETVKNWAAILMGVAALITSINSYVSSPASTGIDSTKALLERINILEKDVAVLNSNVGILFRLKELEEHKRQIASEELRVGDEIDDRYLEQFLTKKYGSAYAKEYISRKQKLRDEIRREYNVNIPKLQKTR